MTQALDQARNYYQDEFIDFLAVERNLASRTLEEYRRDLSVFFEYFKPFLEQDLSLSSIDERTLREFLSYLRQKRKYTPRALNRKISTIRSYFHFLQREGHVKKSPAADLRSVKLPKRYPNFLTEDEVEKLLEGPSGDSWLDLRDRAMLEILYATGIRISELTGLSLEDVDLEGKVMRVRGKGDKERFVLMNDTARQALEHYLVMRPKQAATRHIFLSKRYSRISVKAAENMFAKYLEKAGIQKKASPHTLRHSFATHLLVHGSDLMTIKELLGHSSLSTTQIYTDIDLRHMRETYDQAHPRK